MTDIRLPKVALLGNPNTGKTSLFNCLTGMSQRTGNFPGCTVERKEGRVVHENRVLELIDLPGTYSLAALTPDELVVTETLLNLHTSEQPIDAVLLVVDAACLHRNLYLAHQVRELGLPVVLALNMIDLAEKKGISVNIDSLQMGLGFTVVPTNAGTNLGIPRLKQELFSVLDNRPVVAHEDLFPMIRQKARELASTLQAPEPLLSSLEHILFRALIDEEGVAIQRLKDWSGPEFNRVFTDTRKRLVGKFGRLIDLETKLRYEWVRQLLLKVLVVSTVPKKTFSDKIDKILTHPISGFFILFALLTVVFQSIYTWAGPIMDYIEASVAWLGGFIGASIRNPMLQSLVVDGVISGAGGVLVFLPQIVFLFGFLAILEDCGYMARAAFLMDRIFKGLGLSGKSLIPMISSFACAIPGLMASRTIENRQDRLTTILVAPFMSCSARLPVYAIMIAAFIPTTKVFGPFSLQGITLFAMYSVGILVAIPTAWILKKTVLKGKPQPFLMELPSFKIPNLRTVVIRVYLAGKEFIVRAGTTILAVSIIVWALAYFPRSEKVKAQYAMERAQMEERIRVEQQSLLETSQMDPIQLDHALSQLVPDSELGKRYSESKSSWDAERVALDRAEKGAYLRNSYIGQMGQFCEPIVAPLGWDWRIGVAAFASFPAREIVVATLGVIFNLGQNQTDESEELRDTLRAAVRENGTPLFNIPVALSIMIFFALCAQCAATLAVIKKETGHWRYPFLSFGYMTSVAYVTSFIVFQTTTALGW